MKACIWFLICTVIIFFPFAAKADTVADRCKHVLDDHIDHPYTDPCSSDLDIAIQGALAYCCASLAENRTTGSSVASANNYIAWMNHTANFIPHDSTVSFPGYFCISLLPRMYADPNMRSRMTAASQADCLEMIWRFLDLRSKVSDTADCWNIWFTENHNAMCRSAYYIGAQVLKNAGPPYGPNLVLGDGKTVQAHYDAWKTYWTNYFKERGKKGINIEVASPQYEKYTMAAIYNIADYAENPILAALAQNFISLYWADVAQDFVKNTGIRGGGGTRMYNDTYLTTGTAYSFRQWLWMYNWHNTDCGSSSHPTILCAASSKYRIPDIIRACAVADKTSYQYTSRRYARSSVSTSNVILFPSYVRRDTSANKDYVLGSMTYDSSQIYSRISGECRWMGVASNNSVNDRIIVKGLGLGKDGLSGQFELNGICYKDVLVAERDIAATSNESNGTRVFMGGTFATNMVVDAGGWIFSFAGNSYAAIRIANGGNTVTNDTNGKFLEFLDMWSPVVIQMGQKQDFASYTAFQNYVKANTFTYTSGKLTYISKGNTYEMWSNSYNLARINGLAVDVNPAKVYDSPYIQGLYNQPTVTVSFSGYSDLVLSFQDCTAIPLDFNNDCVVNFADLAIFLQSWALNSALQDAGTLALWHMDSISGAKITDDCNTNPSRHNDLFVYNNPTVAASMPNFTNALNLNGITQYGAAMINWASQDSVYVDLWFNTRAAAGAQEIITAINTWNLQLSDSDVQFDMWDDAAPTVAHTIYVQNCVQPGTWQHLTATVDATGNMTLAVDGFAPAALASTGYKLKLQSAAINVGNKAGYSLYFNGLLDEIKLSVPSVSGPVCVNGGYYSSDLNKDCYVDMKDFNIFALSWLSCSTPSNPNCALH